MRNFRPTRHMHSHSFPLSCNSVCAHGRLYPISPWEPLIWCKLWLAKECCGANHLVSFPGKCSGLASASGLSAAEAAIWTEGAAALVFTACRLPAINTMSLEMYFEGMTVYQELQTASHVQDVQTLSGTVHVAQQVAIKISVDVDCVIYIYVILESFISY